MGLRREVVLGAGIFLFARRIADAPVKVRSHLDLLGSLLWAMGMGLVVFGALRSSTWGWLLPAEGGPPSWGCRLCLADPRGFVSLRLFMQHVRHLEAAGREPLVSPALFANKQMTGGVLVFFFQFLVMMGLSS